MGLNLKINRIIFSEVEKSKFGRIPKTLVKQIAGRAGRSTSDGYVSAMYPKDLEYIRECLGNTVSKGETPTDFDAPAELLDENYKFTTSQTEIKKACLFPTINDVIKIAKKLQVEFNNLNNKPVSLYDVFLQFDIHSNSNELYFIRNLKEKLKISYVLKDIESSIKYQYLFVMSANRPKEMIVTYLKKFFEDFNNSKGIVLIPEDLYIKKYNYVNRIVTFDEIVDLQDKMQCKFIYFFNIIYLGLEMYTNLSHKFGQNFKEFDKSRFLRNEYKNVINMLLKHGIKHDFSKLNKM